MSANHYDSHVFVLPEDDANRQLATGFQLEVDSTRLRRMQVLGVAGGWNHVLRSFTSDHVTDMRRYPKRHIVLLIDFDGSADRLGIAKAEVPDDISERVFFLGVWTKPEALKPALGSYETIGRLLGSGCRQQENDATWAHPLLQHNAGELVRLRERVRPILF